MKILNIFKKSATQTPPINLGNPTADTVIIALHGGDSNGKQMKDALNDRFLSPHVTKNAQIIIPTATIAGDKPDAFNWYPEKYHTKIVQKFRHATGGIMKWFDITSMTPPHADLLDDIINKIPEGKKIILLGYSEGGIFAGHYGLMNSRVSEAILLNSDTAYCPKLDARRPASEGKLQIHVIQNTDDDTLPGIQASVDWSAKHIEDIATVTYTITTDTGHNFGLDLKEKANKRLEDIIPEQTNIGPTLQPLPASSTPTLTARQ